MRRFVVFCCAVRCDVLGTGRELVKMIDKFTRMDYAAVSDTFVGPRGFESNLEKSRKALNTKFNGNASTSKITHKVNR